MFVGTRTPTTEVRTGMAHGDATRQAFAHIVDATSRLSREEVYTVATALRAGWLTINEKAALADLANGFERMSVADAPEDGE